MKTIRIDYQNIPALAPSACAAGYFDGLHQGHRQLVKKAQQLAAACGLQSAVLTFDPDPWAVLRPGEPLDHLTSLKDKEALLDALGVDLFYVVDFSRSFAALSVEEFHEFLRSLQIRKLVCGFDFSYGAKGRGTPETLKLAKGFDVEVISRIADEEEKISSSRIEKLIRNGNIDKANDLLGYFYSLQGTVEGGYQRGRKMDFPTANLHPDAQSLIPGSGVYAGYVQVEDTVYPAMINVGSNPTFDNSHSTVEAFLLGVSLNLYSRAVRFFFAARLRDEVRFDSVKQLRAQLKADEENTLPALDRKSKLFEATAKLWSLNGLDDIIRA